MEQVLDVIATLVGWVAEQFVALAFGSVIGAIGTKWFFGRKNLEELGRLRREVDELKRERHGRAPSPPSAPSSAPTEAPAPRDAGEENHSLVPASSPPDALLSLEELLALVKGRTGIVADQMLKPHKGRRHHVRGAVIDISDYGSDGVQVILDGEDEMHIVLWFNPGSQTGALETLRPGDTVSATGLLRSASNLIGLKECSLDGIDKNGTSLNGKHKKSGANTDS